MTGMKHLTSTPNFHFITSSSISKAGMWKWHSGVFPWSAPVKNCAACRSGGTWANTIASFTSVKAGAIRKKVLSGKRRLLLGGFYWQRKSRIEIFLYRRKRRQQQWSAQIPCAPVPKTLWRPVWWRRWRWPQLFCSLQQRRDPVYLFGSYFSKPANAGCLAMRTLHQILQWSPRTERPGDPVANHQERRR